MDDDKKWYWPKEALENTLKKSYPGSKNILDALDQEMKKRQDLSPKGSPDKEDTVGTFQKAVNYLAELTEKHPYDLDDIPEVERFVLRDMPLNTIEEIRVWTRAWKETIHKYGKKA